MLNAIRNDVHENAAGTLQADYAHFDQMASGFIYHPDHIPLNFRRLWHLPELTKDERRSGKSTLGLSFFTHKHLKAGEQVEVTVHVRGENHKFVGEVVLVKESQRGYDVGIWLRSQHDAIRARIIEQVCYIDRYLQDKQKHSSKPINKEQGTQEWIVHNAAHFPA